MKKKIKIGILIFAVILLIFVFLFLIFNNQSIENENQGSEVMENQKIKLSINNYELTATLNYNSSSIALVEELKKGPITLNMSDYANMEKVGDLGVELPKNDENITTNAGDLILYQGNNFVIYYDTNHWSLTKLGKLDNISSQELKKILGKGDITVKLSLN